MQTKLLRAATASIPLTGDTIGEIPGNVENFRVAGSISGSDDVKQ